MSWFILFSFWIVLGFAVGPSIGRHLRDLDDGDGRIS